MEIQKIATKEIKPYKNNPRKNDSAVDAVVESIKQCGYVAPIIVDENNVILAGHTRFKAIKKLGWNEVGVLVKDGLTEEQKRKYRLLDNKTNELADWDFPLLEEELEGLDFGDLDLDWGVEFGEDENGEAVVEDDFDEEPPGEPTAKLGDIWQLGRHRLMCGDSTDKGTVEKLMSGNKADMVFTDPPYGMKKEKEGIANDNLNYDDLLEFNKKWIPLTFEALKDNGSWYCWGIDEPLMDIYSNILRPMQKQNKITFRNLLTWDKGSGQGQLSEGFRMYPTADEKCLFVMCGVQGFNNNQDNYYEGWEPIRLYLEGEANKVGLTPQKLKEICGVGMWSHWFSKSQFSFITEEHYRELQEYFKYDAFKREYDEIKREYYSTRAYFDNTHDNVNNVWHFDRTGKDERELCGGHATPKPIALCGRAIKSSSREDEIVLDVFGGSGSTLIACEQLDRTCYMMELDPKYVDVIIDRWEKFTGEKAVLLNG